MAHTVDLYSVEQGKVVPFNVEVDQNGELVATNKDETLKFPAGLTKTQFTKLVSDHNKANEGVKARTAEEVKAEEEALARSQKLVDSL